MDHIKQVLAGLDTDFKSSAQRMADFGCPRCKGHLMLRQGPFGDFLGCSNFPECRYTQSTSYNVLR